MIVKNARCVEVKGKRRRRDLVYTTEAGVVVHI